MPVPVIDPTQGVPGVLQWEEFNFQPFAFWAPSSWTTSALPPGLTLNASTGRLSGAVSVPGIYTVGFIAHNSIGSSAQVAFTFAIEPSASVPPSSLIEARWDLSTGAVEFFGFSDKVPPAFKLADNFVIHLTLLKGGLAADLTLSSLKLGMKYEEQEPMIVVSDGFRKTGSGRSTAYLVHVRFAGTALAAALADSEGLGDSRSTDFESRLAKFPALAEFEAVETNPYRAGSPLLGLVTLRRSSQTFPVKLIRDLVP